MLVFTIAKLGISPNYYKCFVPILPLIISINHARRTGEIYPKHNTQEEFGRPEAYLFFTNHNRRKRQSRSTSSTKRRILGRKGQFLGKVMHLI